MSSNDGTSSQVVEEAQVVQEEVIDVDASDTRPAIYFDSPGQHTPLTEHDYSLNVTRHPDPVYNVDEYGLGPDYRIDRDGVVHYMGNDELYRGMYNCIQMERESPESDKNGRRGWRETLRFYWLRTSSVLRSFFTSSKQECNDQTVATRGTSSYESLIDSETDYDIADSLSISGAFIRRWEQICEFPKNTNENSSTIRVASYNVLCQRTFEAHPELYFHLSTSSPSRTWSHRWALFGNEITALDADILGLQEVQEPAFKEGFEQLLENLGYVSLFSGTTMEAHNHGLVIAVKKERFTVESHETVDFYQEEDSVLDRGNIGQIVRLICRKTSSSLLLAHTHLLFDPNRGDTKFAQIAYLLSRVHQRREDDEPILCLGDFNLEPASKLYNYITGGMLNGTSFSIKHGSGQRLLGPAPIPYDEFLYELPRETFIHTMMNRRGEIQSDLFDLLYSLNTTLPNQFSHQLNLVSTYAPHQPPTVSSNHANMSSPDYIFYDRGNGSFGLTLNRRLALPTVCDLIGVEGWPNEHVPSDHICLLAEFNLTRF